MAAVHNSGNFVREIHDTVKGCRSGNAAICYQLISQNAEKIVAHNRMQRGGNRLDPNHYYSGQSCHVKSMYSGKIYPSFQDVDENPLIPRDDKPIECGTMQGRNYLTMGDC